MSLPLATPRDVQPFAAYVCTDAGASLARDVIAASGAPSESLLGGGLSGAARAFAHNAGAHMVLTELGELPVDRACNDVSELCKSGADVIVFGQDPSIQTYRCLRRAGALEYFPMPVSAEDILSVEIVSPKPANLPGAIPSPNRTIGVIGTNGGVGASALAQNLAHLAASQKTALVDADLHFGSIALDLDRDGTPGVLDALNAPDRIDATFLQATMDAVSETLSLYALPVDFQRNTTSDAPGWSAVLDRLRPEFTTTYVDLPRTLILQDPSVLDALDSAILVVPSGYAGVNAAMRLATFVRSQKTELQLVLVLSDVRKDAQLPARDIAKALGLDLTAILPRSDTQFVRALRKGKTVSDLYPRAPYAKACADIVAAIQPDAVPQQTRSGLLGRVFK